jgi:hypothetical protein
MKKDLLETIKKIRISMVGEEGPPANSVGAGGVSGLDGSVVPDKARKKWITQNKNFSAKAGRKLRFMTPGEK